jgi:imidazoleglycerol-phosphate dehydratase
MAKLFTRIEETESYLKLKKETHELGITVELSTEFQRFKVDTSLNFLDHMLYTFSWGACFSIGVLVETGKWRSTHTIAEDVGITIGTGLKSFFTKKLQKEGINITGSSVFGLDESLARAMVNMEGRRNTFFSIGENCPGGRTEIVEDMNSQDMFAFVEGFCQGFPATVHLDFLKGRDPHHVWESAMHAFGEAIRIAFERNPWRKASNNPYYAEEGIADAALG